METVTWTEGEGAILVGEKRIFSRHCRAGLHRRDGSGQTGLHHLVPPLARRSERRKEVATLAGIFPKKFRERNEPGREERDTAFHPSRSYPRFTTTSPIFPAPRARRARWHAKRARPCKTALPRPPLLIVSHADTRIVHLMARARRVTRQGCRF